MRVKLNLFLVQQGCAAALFNDLELHLNPLVAGIKGK